MVLMLSFPPPPPSEVAEAAFRQPSTDMRKGLRGRGFFLRFLYCFVLVSVFFLGIFAHLAFFGSLSSHILK